MFSQAALAGIEFYQHRISPRKGFRCAHSVLHGGTGCSGFAKHAIREAGLWYALPAIRQRFRDCGLAYDALRQDRQDDRTKHRQRTGKRRERCVETACCGAEGCVYLPGACGTAGRAKAGAASKICDVNPCDGDMGCCGFDVCSCG
ncbi:MAG: membrane protein insertion efficiency factor YidD [Pseudomonadota bacterium]